MPEPVEYMPMKVGDKFTAERRIGLHASAAKIFFDFTVTKVTKAGIFYADGTAHKLRTDGLEYRGAKKRFARFRGIHEFQPRWEPGFTIRSELKT